ncbi:MAG: hypothetical protein AAF731_12530 [Bacteroidota bacterium]
MKKPVAALLLLISSISYGQITRNVKIANRAMGHDKLSALYKYDRNNNLKDIQVLYLGIDDRYQQVEIFKYDTIFVGSPREFIGHLNQIISFFEKNEPEVSTQINDHTVVVTKHVGVKALYLYDDKGEAFSIVRINMIRRMKNDVIKWANETGIEYM